jgi:hypothetical protein
MHMRLLLFRPDETHDEHKQLRTGWRVRRRFKLAQRLATGMGGIAALAIVQLAALQLPDPLLVSSQGFLAPAVLLLAAGVAIPYAVVELLWRYVLRRNLHEWGGRMLR